MKNREGLTQSATHTKTYYRGLPTHPTEGRTLLPLIGLESSHTNITLSSPDKNYYILPSSPRSKVITITANVNILKIFYFAENIEVSTI